MNEQYIVPNSYLEELGLNLNDYALEGTLIPAIKNIALRTVLVPRIRKLDDTIKSVNDIESRLDEHPELLNDFYDAQYVCIYNLIFQNETNPIDDRLDNIIVFSLGWGKINGFQKGYFRKQD